MEHGNVQKIVIGYGTGATCLAQTLSFVLKILYLVKFGCAGRISSSVSLFLIVNNY